MVFIDYTYHVSAAERTQGTTNSGADLLLLFCSGKHALWKGLMFSCWEAMGIFEHLQRFALNCGCIFWNSPSTVAPWLGHSMGNEPKIIKSTCQRALFYHSVPNSSAEADGLNLGLLLLLTEWAQRERNHQIPFTSLALLKSLGEMPGGRRQGGEILRGCCALA